MLTPPSASEDITPKQRTVPLPGVASSPPPPSYESSASAITRSTATATDSSTNGSSQAKTDSIQSRSSSSGSSGQPSSGGSSGYKTASGGEDEAVLSPPPTPDSAAAAAAALLAPAASQITIHPPVTPEDIQAQLAVIVEEQNAHDHENDLADLRALMREALAKSSDIEMLRVLQVRRREEMPEAMKTLQRALECEREKDTEAQEEEVLVGEETHSAEDLGDGVRAAKAGGSGPLRLGGLRRRLTGDSVATKASKKSQEKSRLSRTSEKSAKTERDTLDREFIETGIDALRRLSRGQEINLPAWTITK